MIDEQARADLAVLRTTSDVNERNAAALRLAERKIPEAKDALLGLIMRADLREHRGTLVHSLGHFDCSGQFGLLVDLVVTGNVEVAHEAFEILDLIDEVGGEDVDIALTAADGALADPSLESWRRALLDELVEMFD